ncbi:MAG: bactofilin family protein [Burkholderiales bacterium]
MSNESNPTDYPAYDMDATQQAATPNVPAFMLADNAAQISQPMGAALPPSQLANIPMLQPQRTVGAGGAQDTPRTVIADGLRFVGNAQLASTCSISGHVQGDLKQAHNQLTAVVVTETGHVIGDIVANQISVMGRTEGTLDAAGGTVALHDSASVSGHVRYSRIQVNGADLNATLERVATPKN